MKSKGILVWQLLTTLFVYLFIFATNQCILILSFIQTFPEMQFLIRLRVETHGDTGFLKLV